ncbi:hypothetical protein COU54_00055 [Candidatus Pacearchaeota archaeon CG10_big_fil_rev_8_21_14_0_10_31_24]|nr:MAG: hypothetical protein COU54_00055 [Candidatus Pacearchaeota archaeon CG10_big_fil_rev_8_21_14_0_10_31_24]
MGGYHDFYPGSGYNKSSEYGESFLGFAYRTPASDFGVTTDPRSANQLKAVADKINTGAGVIEITAITPDVLENIPNQHLDEINRLRKLTGVNLTFHGPLIEATGISQQGWDETKRLHAERQLSIAVERSHKIDPDGNVIVTLHTTNGLPELIGKEKTPDGKEQIQDLWVVDEREGRFHTIKKPKENHLLKENQDSYKALDEYNKHQWEKQLVGVGFHAYTGEKEIDQSFRIAEAKSNGLVKKEDLIKLYQEARTPEGQKKLKDYTPETQKAIQEAFNDLNHGEIYIKDAYADLQNSFNQAYESAKKHSPQDLKRLNEYREQIMGKIKEGMTNDILKLPELAAEVVKGTKLLSTLASPPKTFTPLQEFALDKASDTYSNVAFSAFKKFGKTAPIISLENPPAGGGLSRGQDLKELVQKTREKFVNSAVDKLKMNKDEAEKQAEKLIGVTWDVGHINMLRKYGYTEKDIVKETAQVKEMIKHVHLSDNFGMEHTELPMGMGNVPTKEHLELINKYNKQVKKIIETGPWYQHFQRTPLPDTLAAFGSPIYSMGMAPYWNQSQTGQLGGAYFSGYGLNPELHHSIYGSGFSTLPVELGGQQSGRSRMSGNPME